MITHNFFCARVYVSMFVCLYTIRSTATNKFISHLFNWKNLRLLKYTICENIFCNNNNFQLLLQLGPKKYHIYSIRLHSLIIIASYMTHTHTHIQDIVCLLVKYLNYLCDFFHTQTHEKNYFWHLYEQFFCRSLLPGTQKKQTSKSTHNNINNNWFIFIEKW